MTALTADRDTRSKASDIRGYPVAASTTIYKGSLVAVNSAGYLVPAADTAGFRVAGVAHEKVANSGSAGDKTCLVESGRAYRFGATSIVQGHVGQMMFVVDDNNFDDTVGTNRIPCGVLLEFDSTTAGWIHIPEGGMPELAFRSGQATTVAASDTIVTGLSTLVSVVATLDSDPVDDPEWVSASIGDQAGAPAAGSFLLKTWKNTGGTDPTPAAATTFSKKVNWMAWGY